MKWAHLRTTDATGGRAGCSVGKTRLGEVRLYSVSMGVRCSSDQGVKPYHRGLQSIFSSSGAIRLFVYSGSGAIGAPFSFNKNEFRSGQSQVPRCGDEGLEERGPHPRAKERENPL